MAVASWVQSVNRERCTRSTPGCGGGLNSVDEWKEEAITLQWKLLHRKGGDLLGLEGREGEEWTIPCRVDRESINSILLMRQPRTWKNHINCPWSHNRLEAELELKFRSCDPYLLILQCFIIHSFSYSPKQVMCLQEEVISAFQFHWG